VCPWLIYFKSSLSSLPLKGSCRFRTSSTLDSIAAIGMLSGSGLSATSAVTTLVLFLFLVVGCSFLLLLLFLAAK
jgi:hypothetical protein